MPSRHGICVYCHKLCLSDAGLSQHLSRCKARASAYRARAELPQGEDAQSQVDRAETVQDPAYNLPSGDGSIRHRHADHDSSFESSETDSDSSSTPAVEDDETVEPQLFVPAEEGDTHDPLGLCGELDGFEVQDASEPNRTGSTDDPGLSDHTDPLFNPNNASRNDLPQMGDGINTTTSSSSVGSITLGNGRLSIASVVSGENKTYTQITGIPAGVGTSPARATVVAADENIQDNTASRYGFKSDVDLALADWFQSQRVSATAIDKLLLDPHMHDVVEGLSYRSADEFRSKIGNMRTPSNIGNWRKSSFTLPCASAPGGVKEYFMRHRDVKDAIKFFLQHQGFKDELVFEPYRSFTGDDPPRRLYGEMASGDWWWNTQVRLGIDGATIIPLIIASDKTLVSNHAGNLEAHAVYLSIGNLKMNTRHSNTRPGSLLLALLPIVKQGDPGLRSAIFHKCFRQLFDPMKRAADGEGLNISCSDGLIRRCFPIVAALTIDYPEQVTFTGVKLGRHCCICKIHPDNREDLEHCAEWRTQADTKRRILEARNKCERDESMDVHDVDCFTWGYKYVDIHSTIMPDLLHQLLKGVLMNAIDWIKALLRDQMTESSPSYRAAVAAARMTGVTNPGCREERIEDIIDRRFSTIPQFPRLRTFPQYSKISMWTGKEQKSMVKQLLVVFTPLLEEIKSPTAIKFLRALVDFILMAGYPSHDDETLRYLDMALLRMNKHKEVFCKYRPADKKGNRHFNYPKWHAITHYVDCIRRYGSLRNYDTNHPEHNHVKMVKDAFKITNKRPGWEDQVIEYGRRQLNVLAAFDEVSDHRQMSHAEQRELAEEPTRPHCPVNVAHFFGWGDRAPGPARHRKVDTTITIEQAARFMGDDDGTIFKEAAAVFVRNATQQGRQPGNPERLEDDSSWISRYYVQFHSAIRTMKQSGDDPDNPEAVEPSIVRAAPNWQGVKGAARRDWIWIQEYTVSQPGTDRVAFEGRLPAQIVHIVTIFDPCFPQTRHCGVLVDIARPLRSGLADEISGLISVKRVPAALRRRPRELNGRQIYPLTSVHHGVHIVPKASFKEQIGADTEYYVNNASDWLTYNTLYNDDWEQTNAREIVEQRHATQERQRRERNRRLRAQRLEAERQREAQEAMRASRARQRA